MLGLKTELHNRGHMEENRVNPVEDAIIVLSENIIEIDRVVEWSQKMGYETERAFSKYFRVHFGKRPKREMISLKIAMAVKLLSKTTRWAAMRLLKQLEKRMSRE